MEGDGLSICLTWWWIVYCFIGTGKKGEVWRGCQAKRIEESWNGSKVCLYTSIILPGFNLVNMVELGLELLLLESMTSFTRPFGALFYAQLFESFPFCHLPSYKFFWNWHCIDPHFGIFVQRSEKRLILAPNAASLSLFWALRIYPLLFSSRRWSKREEVDFYRTVSTFGVEFNKKDGTYDWSRFR